VRPLTISIVYAAAGIFGDFSVNAALLTTLIVDGCVTGMLAVGVIRRPGFARPDRAIARETVSFGLRAHGANVGGIVTARFDLLIMPAILSAASVGVYAVATNVSWIVVSVAGALGPVVLPAAARRGSGHGPRTILPALRATLGIAVVLALLLGAGAGLGVRIVYGHGFGASAPALRLLLPGAICYAGWLVLSSGLQAAGRPLAASLTQLPGVVFTVVGLLLFLRSGGIVAAAVISTIAYASAFLIALVVYRDAARLSWRALVFGRGARGAVAGRRGRWPEAARAR
jgi:O-antigen/teichoic acid export membrane protein